MQKTILFVLIFLGLCSFSDEPRPREHKVFPKPEKTGNMLFYVQRTFNTNTLIYDLNVQPNGTVNEKEPIVIHWVNYATDQSTEGLNYIQRKYAYGLEAKLIDAEKQTYCFNFVSYKKKKLYLMKSPSDGKFRAFCEVNNRMISLDRVFIQIEGGSFWVPHVVYIEISGTDVAKNNETVVERIIPKQ
ncbi:MAG: DUF4833 domain-containing protein [Bacteroidetes bacterium]|nr:DUF4833 domain-containing protein [Bacteroidota bacterium]